MAIRNYSSVAIQTTLVSGIGPSDTTAQLVSAAGLPTPPFTLAFDYNGSTEELIDVTNISGNNITAMTRAVDGTSASSHSPGAVVRHVSSARDFTEANQHINASSGVHGIAGSVVGTTDAQTLSNKNLVAPVFQGTATGVNPVFQMNPMLVQPTASGNLPFVVRGLAGQTGDLMAAQDSGLTRLWTVKADGSTAITPSSTASGATYLLVTTPAAPNNNAIIADFQRNGVSRARWGQDGSQVQTLGGTGTTGITMTGPSGYNGSFLQLINNASTVLTIASDGSIVTNGIISSASNLFVRKTANESRTNTVTYAADSELTVAIGGAGTYIFECFLVYEAVSGVGINVRMSYSGTSSSSRWTADILQSETSGSSGNIRRDVASLGTGFGIPGGAGAGSPIAAKMSGIVNTTGAGNLFFEWSQNTSSATATQVDANSYIRVTRVA